MAKVKTKLVQEKLDQWAEIQAQLAKAQAAKEKALAPHLQTFNEATKPAQEKYAKAVEPLNKQAAELAKEIESLCKANVDAEGNPVPVTVEATNAIAEVTKGVGNRVVDPKKFFDFVKDKNEKFWSSITVVLKKAEEVIGKKELDELADKPTKIGFAISLKKG